jgi:hypothetical protein
MADLYVHVKQIWKSDYGKPPAAVSLMATATGRRFPTLTEAGAHTISVPAQAATDIRRVPANV